jgi:hypothetical protein
MVLTFLLPSLVKLGVLLHKMLEITFAYKPLYLIFQGKTLFGVVDPVYME